MTPPSNKLAEPEIFDVTVRDGSYTIDFQFQARDVQYICTALDHGGFRYIEVGHGQGLNASNVNDPAAATDEKYLEAAQAGCKRARFGTFFIPGIGDYEHLRWARESFGMHFVRIGSEPERYERMLPYLEYAKNLGYEVMCNFMKTYCEPAASIARKAARLAEAGADAVYVVDSAGGMLPDEVGEYCRAIREHTPVRIGFHGHNNLELASSNSLSAWRNGASLIDCSIGGLGRSSGNTRTELFIPVLKALGVATPYDYAAVLTLWQQTIRPLIERRTVSAQEIVGGYARIHSGLMKPFLDAARKHDVDIVALLDAYGDALHGGNTDPAVDQIAANLGGRSSRGVSRASASLLKYCPPLSEDVIQNTFQSFDEALQSVHVLAHKACLPVAALVDIAPSEEPYVVAEYLYHDDHFLVVRAAFGSVASFVEAIKRHPHCFDVLVFDARSSASRTALASREAEWKREQRVLWADVEAAKYHVLFTTLYQALGECHGRSVLFLGGNPERLARLAPPIFDTFDLYCQTPGPQTASRITTGRTIERSMTEEPPEQFDVAVVLAQINTTDLEPIIARIKRPGILLDGVDLPVASTRYADLEIRSLSLWRALTGVLLTLLPAADAAEESILPLSGEPRVYPSRAA